MKDDRNMPRPFGLVHKIGSPSQARDRIKAQLSRPIRSRLHNLTVHPCDERGRQCAAWTAHHYRVHAYYVSGAEPLGPLAAALKDIPGVYEVHEVRDGRFGNLRDLRVQVIALMTDPATAEDAEDAAEAEAAMAEPGEPIPLEQIEAELGVTQLDVRPI